MKGAFPHSLGDQKFAKAIAEAPLLNPGEKLKAAFGIRELDQLLDRLVDDLEQRLHILRLETREGDPQIVLTGSN
jgi:hypothetical protein